MSAESGMKAAGKGCTRELFLRTEFTDLQEKLNGMVKVCYELLKVAAENEFLNRHRSVSTFEKEEYRHAVSDIVVQLYEFLRSLLEHEKENSASKTLDRALVSPKSLRIAWKRGKRNSLTGNKRASASENLDDEYRQRWVYYRKRLVGVLRDRGRRVATRDMGEGWKEHSFSYGSKELPALRKDQFMESIDGFVGTFKPTLKDDDFWLGEEVVYRKDGTEGRREGPGEDKLDQFCREFWEFAAEFFGQEYLLELSMVMKALPRLYTYFARPNELFLDESPEEDQNGEEKPQVELRSEAPAFDAAEMVVQELEARREAIVAVARTLCPRDRKLILMTKANLPDVEKARRLGLSSSSRISEQTVNAFRKFSEAGLMDILPEVKEPTFYLEGMVDIAEAVWLDEKKELEAVGSLENRI